MIASPPLSGVIGRIARLPDTKFEDIKSLWKQLFDVPMPTHNRQYLEKRIAYRIQEIDLAQREPGALERHKARIDALLDATKPKAKAGRGEVVKLVPGTMLTREFNGVVHRVVAMPNGQFEYKGKPYNSLSPIANEISGTRWSGPAFFGLKTSKSTKGSK
jgi:hypothetical protein